MLYLTLAYLSGSIPFGLILSNLFGKGNLREMGSKNIGATNVVRTQGKTLGALTFLLDFLKTYLPCYFLKTDSHIINLLILAAPVLGHIFPVWLKFKGGKGIASYLALLLAIDPIVFLFTISCWLIGFAITKISAVAGLSSVILSVLAFFIKNLDSGLDKTYVLIALVFIIIIRHHENIKKLCSKEYSHNAF